MRFLCLVHCGNHDALQRLAYLNVHLPTESQYHGCNLLSHIHASFKVKIDH